MKIEQASKGDLKGNSGCASTLGDSLPDRSGFRMTVFIYCLLYFYEFYWIVFDEIFLLYTIWTMYKCCTVSVE